MDADSIMIVIILWVCAIPSGLKYYNLLNTSKEDDSKLKKAKKSFRCSLFIAIAGTIAAILGI